MRPSLLLLGDSITEKGSQWENDGWVCLLLNRYNRSADIVQRGMGGYTTKNFMDLVFKTLSEDLGSSIKPHLITLWLGANDAALPDGPSKGQYVPLDKYKENLHTLVGLFKQKAPNAKIVLITPPAVDDARRQKDRSNATTGLYAKACVEVAKAETVESLDLWTIFNDLPLEERNSLLCDGLHLTKKGNHLMEEKLVDLVKQKFPDLQQLLDHREFPLYIAEEEPRTSALDAPVAWWKWFLGTE